MKGSEGFGDITNKKGNKYFYGAGKFSGQKIKAKPAPKKKTDPGLSRARATAKNVKRLK